jgi:hypothetical protein
VDLSGLWVLIEEDLTRARDTLPNNAAGHEAIRQYQEFLDHNELELACDMFDIYAEDHPVSRRRTGKARHHNVRATDLEFWLALRDAAEKMQMPDRVARYEKLGATS